MKMEHFIKWIKAAGARAIRTVAQTMAASISTAAMFGDVEWIGVCSTAALAGFLSLLTSVSGLPELKSEMTGDGAKNESH